MNGLIIGIIVMLVVNFLGVIVIGIRVEIRGERNEGYERRLAVLEENARTAPSHSDLAAIRDRIGGVSGQVSGMSERMNVHTEMLRTIQKHLLERER